jgi:hypothetical protein
MLESAFCSGWVFVCGRINQPAGLFVLDPSRLTFQEGKLTEAGIWIRFQEQPLQILALLLERPDCR